RGALLGLPAAPLPAGEPAGGAVPQIVGAGVDGDYGARRQALEGGGGAQEVELVRGRRALAAGERPLLASPAHERRPAALAAGAADAEEDLRLLRAARRLRLRRGAQELRPRRRRQAVGALVVAVARVAAHPLPGDLLGGRQLGQAAPEVLVLERPVLPLEA